MEFSNPVELLLGWLQLLAIESHKQLDLVLKAMSIPSHHSLRKGSMDWRGNSPLTVSIHPALGIQT